MVLFICSVMCNRSGMFPGINKIKCCHYGLSLFIVSEVSFRALKVFILSMKLSVTPLSSVFSWHFKAVQYLLMVFVLFCVTSACECLLSSEWSTGQTRRCTWAEEGDDTQFYQFHWRQTLLLGGWISFSPAKTIIPGHGFLFLLFFFPRAVT